MEQIGFIAWAWASLWVLFAFMLVVSYSPANRLVYGFGLTLISVRIGYAGIVFLLVRIEDSYLNLVDKGSAAWNSLYRTYVDSSPSLEIQVISALVLALLIWWVVQCFKIGKSRYISTYTPDWVPEKMVPGNHFQLNAKAPKFQAELYGSTDDRKYFPIGQCFWVENYLLTAGHVVFDYSSIKIVNGDNEYIVPSDHWVLKEGDLAMLPVQPGFTSKLQLSKGKLTRKGATNQCGLMAHAVAFGQRSSGFVDPHEQFGYVTYAGSTVKGFSGAPYYLNNTIFGMHLGGNHVNLGYDAAYIRSLLKPTTVISDGRLSNEDSMEWFLEQAEHQKEVLFDRSPYDPDTYRVKLNGTYHMVDDTVMSRLLQTGKTRQRETTNFDFESADPPNEDGSMPLCPRNAMAFNDSGNLIRAPANAGARGQEPDPAIAQPLGERTSVRTDSVSQPPLARSDMESQTLTRVPQSVASRSTQRRKRNRTRSGNQRSENLISQLSALLSRIGGGQPLSNVVPQMNGLNPSLIRPSVNSITTAPQVTVASVHTEPIMERS